MVERDKFACIEMMWRRNRSQIVEVQGGGEGVTFDQKTPEINTNVMINYLKTIAAIINMIFKISNSSFCLPSRTPQMQYELDVVCLQAPSC